MELVWTAGYAIIVALSVWAALSMEYYARKARVSASSSVPWMRKAVIARLKTEIAEKSLKNPLIVDLGSGFGSLALAAAREYPAARVVGYEISPVPLLFSRLRKTLGGHKNLTFFSGDMLKKNFGDADIILTYLIMPVMTDLAPKFKAELKPEAIVICNTFPIPGWTPAHEETIQDFIYTLKVFTYYADHNQQPSSNAAVSK